MEFKGKNVRFELKINCRKSLKYNSIPYMVCDKIERERMKKQKDQFYC